MLGILSAAPQVSLARDIDPPKKQDTFQTDWDRAQFSHALWDGILQSHVTDAGRVDYPAFKSDPRFDEYLYRLAAVDPRKLPDPSTRKAFWLNAYNALTIQGVLATLPKNVSQWPSYNINEQRIDGKTLWDGLRFRVGREWRTLNDIENRILRKEKDLKDPRIHVALVCASKGCPPLLNRAFAADTVDKQLNAQMRAFLSNPNMSRIDARRRTIKISKVFEWYGHDVVDPTFNPHASNLPKFLALFIDDADTAQALKTRKWKIAFIEYDWTLNIQS
jgi:hypothetical protein